MRIVFARIIWKSSVSWVSPGDVECSRFMGLSEDYKQKSIPEAKWRFYGLSLLPANEVEVTFVEDVFQTCLVMKFADYVVEDYLDAWCDFPPILWAESPDLNPATTNGCKSYHAHLNAEFYSAQLNQTFTCSLRRYCDNRHPRTFLWRHFHSYGQFARTGERSPHCCDAYR